jgi:ElaB/YqjD/DUF883 family membrane-anchored ribosome-binding protein
MDTTEAKNGITEAANKVADRAEQKVDEAGMAIEERIAHARDLVEDLRDRAKMAFHERPYLLPVATAVLGLGIGILIGSKLSRLIMLTAAGALLSETVRKELARVSRQFLQELGQNVEREGEDVEERNVSEEPATTPTRSEAASGQLEIDDERQVIRGAPSTGVLGHVHAAYVEVVRDEDVIEPQEREHAKEGRLRAVPREAALGVAKAPCDPAVGRRVGDGVEVAAQDPEAAHLGAAEPVAAEELA